MTWVAAGVGIAGVVSSGVSANKAGKAADKNAASQRDLMQQDLNERRRVAARQEGIYGPIEERMASQALATGIDPIRAGVIRSRVGTEFDTADRNISRLIGTRGVASGLGASMLGSSQMNRARALASGMVGEYQNKDAMRMQLLSRYNPVGNAEFASQGLRGMASFYGDRAAQARASEQQGYQAMGQGLMNSAMLYASRAPSSNGVTNPTTVPTETLRPMNTTANVDRIDASGFSSAFPTPGVVPTMPTSPSSPYGVWRL